jgi:tetratricopeptide (TPR) repeat protein
VLIIVFVSYFPLSYLSYLQFRAESHKERVKDDFRLLGLVQGASGAAELDLLYRRIYSWQQFVIYVSLTTLTTLLGFGLFHFRAILAFVPEMVAVTMFHSFLGAYVFSIYYTYRRYITLDLQPGVYLYITVRMITVQAIAFVAAQQLQTVTGGAQALVPIAAFVMGYVPETGIRWLTAAVGHLLGRFLQRNERQLSNIDGISLWHETRLRESGIDNVQNLAAADVRELLLGSRFSAQQLMHWIDQAILIASLPEEKYNDLCHHGICTISALRLLGDKTDFADLPLEKVSVPELRALYYAAETGPNLHYVAQYWSAVKQYRIEIVARGLAELLREQTKKVAKDAFADADVVERLSQVIVNLEVDPQELGLLFPDDPASLVGLGSAYIKSQLYDDAVRVLTRAIEVDGQGAAAYSNRGLAYAMQGHYDQALVDFERAKQLAPDYAVTFNHEGVSYIQRENYQQAIAALDRAIELDRSYAQSYYNRGYARRRLGQFDEATDDFGQALRHDPKLDLAYVERGLTYLSLSAYIDAIRDFDEAIRIDRTNARAYSNRGIAYIELGDYSRAIYDLDTAIELLDEAIELQPDMKPNLAAAYSNRGQARLNLGDAWGATDDFTHALRLDNTLAQAYKSRALARIEFDALPEAIADFQHYLGLQPDAPDADDVREQIERLQQQLSTETPSPTADLG